MNKKGFKSNEPMRFMAIASKSHSHIAADMADDIKKVVYKYSDQIPLALAIGVLNIVTKEILDDAD